MRIKGVALGIIVLFAGLVGRADLLTHDFSVPKGPPTDLLKETRSLNLQSEASVQEPTPPSVISMSLLGGVAHPSFLSVESHGHTVNYGFSAPVPLVTTQFTYLPWVSSWGKWGWEASLGYSYSEYKGYQDTALHFLPANVSAFYRAEMRPRQKVIPYLGLGPTLWTYVQRGLDEYNTSGSVLLGSLTAGLSLNLNRMGIIDSRNETDVVLQYQRHFGSSTGVADFNGDTLEIGGTLTL